MTGLDTNVLVRYLTQDDPAQAKRATQFIEHERSEENPGFIGLIVLLETVWVLQRLFAATQDEVRETVKELLISRAIVIQSRDVVQRAVFVAERTGAQFADTLIAISAVNNGCDRVVTFDRRGARAGMVVLT